jgi:hypothetical protein
MKRTGKGAKGNGASKAMQVKYMNQRKGRNNI